MRIVLVLSLITIGLGGCVELASLMPSSQAPAPIIAPVGSVSSTAPAWTSPYECVVEEGNGRYTSCGAVN